LESGTSFALEAPLAVSGISRIATQEGPSLGTFLASSGGWLGLGFSLSSRIKAKLRPHSESFSHLQGDVGAPLALNISSSNSQREERITSEANLEIGFSDNGPSKAIEKNLGLSLRNIFPGDRNDWLLAPLIGGISG
jgi:hypothetical protein